MGSPPLLSWPPLPTPPPRLTPRPPTTVATGPACPPTTEDTVSALTDTEDTDTHTLTVPTAVTSTRGRLMLSQRHTTATTTVPALMATASAPLTPRLTPSSSLPSTPEPTLPTLT